MALLPQEPKQRNALIAIVLTAAGLYAAYTYMYSPTKVELDEIQARIESLETKNRLARTQAARGGQDLEERNALYERHVMELEQLIPQNEEVPQLLRTISGEARQAGIELATLNPEPDTPSEFYVKKSWALTVNGEYDDVGRFITSMASLPRIITPVDLELAPYNPPVGVGLTLEFPVSATFRIETYVLPDPSAVPVDSTAAPAPGARVGG